MVHHARWKKSISDYNFPVANLTFPAVTICADAPYNKYAFARMLLNMYMQLICHIDCVHLCSLP